MTVIFLIAAIVFLVLGWYTFENVALSCIAVIVAIIALCGLFTKSFINAFNNSFDKLLGVYNKAVRFCTNHKVTSFGLVGLFIAILVYLMAITPTALVPTEDIGTIMGAVTLPPATSQERTQSIMNQVDSIVGSIPAVQSRTAITGYSFVGGQGNTYGSFIIKLKPWDQRDEETESASAVLGQLFMMTGAIKDARIMFFQPPMISGYSATNGFEIKLQDKTYGRSGQVLPGLSEIYRCAECRSVYPDGILQLQPNIPAVSCGD